MALFMGFVFTVQGFAQNQNAQGKTKKTVAFERYDQSYFIKSNAGLKDEGSFLVLTNQDDFDAVFGAAATMNNNKFLSQGFFDTKLIVVTNKAGNFMRKYDVKRVAEKNGKLYVWYNTSDKKMSGSWNTFMSLAVAKGKYKEIVFMENGQKIAEVPVED
jgi:hypothetical protein